MVRYPLVEIASGQRAELPGYLIARIPLVRATPRFLGRRLTPACRKVAMRQEVSAAARVPSAMDGGSESRRSPARAPPSACETPATARRRFPAQSAPASNLRDSTAAPRPRAGVDPRPHRMREAPVHSSHTRPCCQAPIRMFVRPTMPCPRRDCMHTLPMNRRMRDRSCPPRSSRMEAYSARVRCSIRAKSAHSCIDPLTVVEVRDTVAATRKGVRQEGLE